MIAIYARVSTEDQAKNGYSLMDQVRACRKLAGTDNVIEYIDDGVSGEILDRPQLTRLREDISRGIINKVLCLDPDRLSRKLMNQLIISEEIEKKAELQFVNGEYGQTAEGRLFYQLRGAISEFEKAKINERMSRGRREKARQGKVVRDYSIYGYDYDPVTQQLVINPFEAEIVHTIFAHFTKGSQSISGINGLAKYLTEMGIPTKRGAQIWHRQVIRQILMNRAYIGEFYQNRWNCEGMLPNKFREPDKRVPLRVRPSTEWILVPCPKIIDPELFSYTQDMLEESRRRWSGTAKNSYLLSGLVRCGLCGNSMTGRKSLNWGKPFFEYSDIKGSSGVKSSGCGVKIKAEILEKEVWGGISELIKKYEISHLSSIEASNQVYPDNTYREQRLSDIRKARNNILKVLSAMSDDIGQTGVEELRLKLKKLKAEEEQLINPSNYSIDFNKTSLSSNINDDARNYYIFQNSELLNFQDKQILLRNLIKEIVVSEDEIIIKGF